MKNNYLLRKLDLMIPNPKCELDYKCDYELLIATVLSAQATDKSVNMVTKKLWEIYTLNSLSCAEKSDIEKIIRPVGTYQRKSAFIIEVAKNLIENYEGRVPNDRAYLESLPGVGRKTANVVLSNIFNEPAIAVDTHVERVSKRLALVKEKDNVLEIEKKLMLFLPQDKWNRVHNQLVLFGRYICKSKNPLCGKCLFKSDCLYFKKTS